MIRVLLIAGGIWALGWGFGLPRRVRWGLIGILWLAVVLGHLVLPDGHAVRAATGGSAVPWVMLAVLGGLAALYARAVLWAKRRARPELVRGAGALDGAAGAQVRDDAGAGAGGVTKRGALSEDELRRYARHIMLREIGGPGQMRLARARVLVVGAGGLGAPVLLYLAAAGVGEIIVMDDDVVELSNLQRQVLHGVGAVGRPKVDSVRAALAALNPHVRVTPVARRFEGGEADLLAGCDLVIDGSDSFATRRAVNAAAVAAGVPLLSGAISQWEGQVSLFDPARGGPCYACVFPQAPAPGLAPGCAEAGVVGPLPGVIGSIMAVEAIKHLTGAGETLRGRMLIHDALYAETREVALSRDPACGVCG